MEKFFTRVCGCVVATVLMVAMSAQAFATSKTVTVTEAGMKMTIQAVVGLAAMSSPSAAIAIPFWLKR